MLEGKSLIASYVMFLGSSRAYYVPFLLERWLWASSDEESECATDHSVTERVVLISSASLETRLTSRRIGVAISSLRSFGGVDESVASQGAGPPVGARGGDELDAADLAAGGGVCGEEGGALGVGLGHDFAGGGGEVASGRGDLGAAGGVGGGFDHGWAVLGLCDGVALRVGADDGNWDGGGDLAKNFGSLHNGAAAGGDGGLDGDDDRTRSRGSRCWRRCSSSTGALRWLISSSALLRWLGAALHDRRWLSARLRWVDNGCAV